MAQTIQNFAFFDGTTYTGNPTVALALSAGTSRKVVVAVVSDSGTFTTVTGVSYNGTAGSQAVFLEHPTNTAVSAELWYVDVSDALGAGSYDVVVTLSNGACSVMAWQLDGAATGAAEATCSGSQTTASATVTASSAMTCSSGAAVLAAVVNSAGSATWDSYGGGLVERQENNEANWTSAAADFITSSAGDVTPSATASSTSTDKVIVALSVAPAGAPEPSPIKNALLMGVG